MISQTKPRPELYTLRFDYCVSTYKNSGDRHSYFRALSQVTHTLSTVVFQHDVAVNLCPPLLRPGEAAFLADRFENTDLPRPKFLVKEECRERWGHYCCDGRRNIRDIMKDFPDAGAATL